ncbi:MAG: hypothetical protein AAGM04_12540 [Pseudomonadota bacterium]
MMDIFEQLERADAITQDHVNQLRSMVFSAQTITRPMMERLLSIVTEGEDCIGWQWFLNEVCVEFFLRSARPHGYFCDESLAALPLFRGSNRANPAATRALVHVLQACRAAPIEAAELAMERAEADILGHGRMDEAAVVLLRDLLYAQGSLHGLGVSRQEAELLFTINDHLRENENHPAWVDLFCKAIGNHLMVQHGYVAPSRAEALRLDDWVEDTAVNPLRFMARMGKSVVDGGLVETFKQMGQDDRNCIYKQRNDAFERAAAEAAPITEEEAAWLSSRIDSNGVYCATEKALIAYLSALCDTDLPATLNRYRDAA